MTTVASMPLHLQVQNQLFHEIEVGAFAHSERLPSESDLCDRFGVSRVTVRRAIADLETAGHVRRQQGRGTFIVRQRDRLGTMSLDGFSDLMVGEGTRSRRIVRAETSPADDKMAKRLGVKVGDPVFHLVRVLALDGTPLILDSSRYPLTRYPGFDERVTAETSTYQILRDEYDVVFTEMHREIGVAFANTQTAEWLERPTHDALVLIRKRAIGEHGEVVHTTRGRIVPSRLTLHMVTRTG